MTIQAQILDLLRRLQAEQGMGLLLITHDLAVVAGMAHRVALMYAGQIIEVASAEEFFSEAWHPYARLLLRALPDSAKRGQALAAIAGMVPPLWQDFDGCRFAPRCDQAFADCAGTRPELIERGSRQVRCLLYRAHGAGAATAPPAPVETPVDAPVAPPAAAPEPPPAAVRSSPVPDAGAPPDRAPALLEVRHLSVRFAIRRGLLQRGHAAFTAVDDVSFRIAPSQTLALVGESGCGKTTTGKAIVQLLRTQALLQGQALFEGTDLFSLSGEPLRAARRGVQIIFQDPFASLNPRMRVLEILEEGLLALRPELDRAACHARLVELVDQVGLRRYPHEFSGGQRQRIAIARALAVAPKLIVCDEPTSALDVSVQAQILNLLRQLQRDLGVSYLFITHNIGVVEYIADTIAVMNRGRIEEAGPARAILEHPQSAYTRTLLAAVPRIERRTVR